MKADSEYGVQTILVVEDRSRHSCSRTLSAAASAASSCAYPASEPRCLTPTLCRHSVKFYSSYLPVLYSELWKQNKALENETMHTREKILRLHSRPKIVMCA